MDRFFTEYGPIPMVTLNTKNRYGKEAITPRGIATGYGDKYLVQISKAANRFGRDAYIRPFAEMNGHWNHYCAFNSNGSSRGSCPFDGELPEGVPRIYLIMKGGPRADINASSASIGMPSASRLRRHPRKPVDAGGLEPAGLRQSQSGEEQRELLLPRRPYVDVVANDIYDIRFRAADGREPGALQVPSPKPYAIGEWGLWGIDDPAFVRHMAEFVSSHPRVEAIV